MLKDREIAKWNLAVNLWNQLQAVGAEYKWLADELTKRTGDTIYASRIQAILHQTNSPEWAFVVNIAEILDCSVEELAKKPLRAAEKAYLERFPKYRRDCA